MRMCVCACVHVCVRACVRACVHASLCGCVCAVLAASRGISCGGGRRGGLAGMSRGSSDGRPRLVPRCTGMTPGPLSPSPSVCLSPVLHSSSLPSSLPLLTSHSSLPLSPFYFISRNGDQAPKRTKESLILKIQRCDEDRRPPRQRATAKTQQKTDKSIVGWKK